MHFWARQITSISGACQILLMIEMFYICLRGLRLVSRVLTVLDWAIGSLNCTHALKSKDYACTENSNCVDLGYWTWWLLLQLGVSNGRVGLKLKLLKWIEIEIGLSLDPPKYTLSSNGLKNGLGLDPPNLIRLISIILTQ